ncbi:SCO3870 family protein [Streptomyces netropsis]|uniref:Uncharacterized protein n=1 Tax=Streptomyces netropsis TaxID=55404 RepID=A0A7W7L9S5_STRNE|nr:SCO3870 family protein [Streptomyces netropsis]MBB4886260.1 hypothetical protein [Streptomyces netropsis]GGR15289.1 hypothetical protein GCM10010219_20260 [Streptomyces netropsis]
MSKAPFAALSSAIAALGTALAFLAAELRADGYEQYVESVSSAAAVMFVTAGLVVMTWVRDGQARSD